MPIKFTKKAAIHGFNRRMNSNLANRLGKKLSCNNISYDKDYCEDHKEYTEKTQEQVVDLPTMLLVFKNKK